MELLLSLALGIGLAAACGFRVFVPALLASGASVAGWIDPGEGFAWLASYPAVIALATASAVEVAAYYVPWVDNALDAVAGPLAVIAGATLASGFIDIDSELLRWGIGLLAGGGSAGAVQLGTTLLRGGSTATTGGLANPVVSTGENVAAAGVAGLAILAPIAAIVAVAAILFGFVALARRLRGRRRGANPAVGS